ncbi:hypothetical protein SBD_0885 [Streptomyces bottropensis ATCC 25435]|uniref:Uncharacterized protein n=1 Tax=Streptomyces bottropensis ATCC 25435 TaxID=1054862 RepID=M3F961_9ACTN|nr:hypothetical protein SBD_0885 [Streptomyces bottropensis ATCC 25435]
MADRATGRTAAASAHRPRLLTGAAVVTAVCSIVCLGLLMVVGTARLPGNPLPEGWSDPEVRAAVHSDGIAG